MKSHVVFDDCTVKKTEKGIQLVVGKAITVDGPRKKGEVLNPEMIKGSLGPMFRDWLVNAEPGAYIEIGGLYVGVGGIPIISHKSGLSPLSLIRLPLQPEMRLDVHQRIVDRFEGEPLHIAVALVRDWTAPRTNGWIDGGAAGILDKTFPDEDWPKFADDSPLIRSSIICSIWKEMAEEIGIEAMDNLGFKGWVGFNLNPWLVNIGREAWNADGNAPRFTASIKKRYPIAPDSIMISSTDYDTNQSAQVDDVALAFETKENATVEILKTYDLQLNPDWRYSFIDREKYDGQYVGRKIALICFGQLGKPDFVVYFQDGKFDKKSLGDPISDDFLKYSCSDKFRKLYLVIKQQMAAA